MRITATANINLTLSIVCGGRAILYILYMILQIRAAESDSIDKHAMIVRRSAVRRTSDGDDKGDLELRSFLPRDAVEYLISHIRPRNPTTYQVEAVCQSIQPDTAFVM